LLELDGPGQPFEFSGVPDGTVLPDGKVIVLDAASHEVRVFDNDGSFLRAIGREGEGPGEFSRLTSVARVRGDSILVFDFWLRRATVLDADGNLGRVFTVAPGLQLKDVHAPGSQGLIAVAWSLEDFFSVEGSYRGQYLILRVGFDGAIRDTIGVVTGWSGYKVNREDGSYSDYAPLFPVDGHVAANSDVIITGDAERMEFVRYTSSGRISAVIRAPVLDRPLTAEEIQSEREAMAPAEAPQSYRSIVQRLPAPEVRPAYRDLKVDPEGFAWVAPYMSRVGGDESRSWYVFDPEGTWLGTVTLPPRFNVLEIGRDYILGTKRDELNVERIQLLRLNR
jgi:hypothetical protein